MTELTKPGRPEWAQCGHGADLKTDSVGCRGIIVSGHTVCLAHLNESDRAAYLATLEPGADIDHRGTCFSSGLIEALLKAVTDPDTQRPRLNNADFKQATFTGSARFDEATFTGAATFNEATFNRMVGFAKTTFSGGARFGWANFHGSAWFHDATFADTTFTAAKFHDDVTFNRAKFFEDVRIVETTFAKKAEFNRVTFSRRVYFDGATFEQDADLSGAWFNESPAFGPVVCAGELDLSAAAFEVPVILEIAAAVMLCVRTKWTSTATLRLRHATVNVNDALWSAPVAIIAHPAPFVARHPWAGPAIEGVILDEGELSADAKNIVKMASISGVDAAHLVLSDVDLRDCEFTGASHLDQLRLEGICAFAYPPLGWQWWHRIWPYRRTPRRTLAEEHHWRALTSGAATPDGGSWTPCRHANPALTPDPADVAAIYRQLRKAF